MYNSQGGVMEEGLTKLAVIIICDDPTGYDEMVDYFATEADTIMDIVCEVDVIKDKF